MFSRLIKSLWIGCGIGNTAVIASSNTFNGAIDVVEEVTACCEWSRANHDHPYETMLFSACVAVYLSLGLCIYTSIKSTGYLVGGPIATYRIGLAYRRYTKTHDARWITTLTHPASINSRDYIMWPIGDASWRW